MAPAAVASAEDIPVDVRSVKALQLQQLKRTFDLFAGNYGVKPDVDNNRYADLVPAAVKRRLHSFQHVLKHLLPLCAVKKPS